MGNKTLDEKLQASITGSWFFREEARNDFGVYQFGARGEDKKRNLYLISFETMEEASRVCRDLNNQNVTYEQARNLAEPISKRRGEIAAASEKARELESGDLCPECGAKSLFSSTYVDCCRSCNYSVSY